jgi:hypothetical protein
MDAPMNKRLNFVDHYQFDSISVNLLRRELTGIYFIMLQELEMLYPFMPSRLLYIGMSESTQHSISKRLRGHLSGQSGNIGLKNFAKAHKVQFTFLSLEVLSILGTRDVRELESFFLSDFAYAHGCYPICNGQSGAEFPDSTLPHLGTTVAWEEFHLLSGK